MEAWWSEIELPRPEWLAALLVLAPMIGSARRGLRGLAPRRRAAALFCRAAVVVALVLALCGVRVREGDSPVFPAGKSGPSASCSSVAPNVSDVEGRSHVRRRVLLVESAPRPAGRLARALRSGRIDVECRQPDELPESANELEPYDLVVLSNVPAAAIERQMDALESYVRDSGGGLIVVGGDQAFTAGGYRQTTLEKILPVVCVADRQHERPSLALVLVIDRSGSMEGEAMDLAKEATRGAVRMLGTADQVGVMAFEDNSRWVTPLQPCADKGRVLAAIDTIVAGGGTDLYSALDKAYLALDETFAELKHMIVLTDGASHPGDFEALITKIAEAGITVSTVAVGREALAGLLGEMARIGRGHYYLCDDPAAVPEAFAMETAAASRVGIVERPFFAQLVDPAPALAEIDFQKAPSLLGYVQTKAKPTARPVLATERGDPLLIWWRYGLGLAVAFTSDAQPRWAAPWLRWPDFDRFWSLLADRAMRSDDLLRSIAEAPGGTYAPEPSAVMAASGQTVPGTTLLWPALLAAAAVLLVVDVGIRRLV